MARSYTFRRIVELCDGQLIPVDEGVGWPSIADLKLSDSLVRVALHVGSIGLSHRGRDDVERRFQNPGQNKPVVSPEGCIPMLVGLWEEDGHPVLVGMEAQHRVGTMTRQSLFIPLDALKTARRRGWAEHYSTTDEHIIAFHPQLIGTYFEMRKAGVDVPGWQLIQALEAAGLGIDDDLTPVERARVAASRLARRADFGRRLVKHYGGLCAMCGLDFGLVQGGHIYPVEAPNSSDELWNGLALCSNHHTAFDRHLVWVEPESRRITVHPDVRGRSEENEACRQFVGTTRKALSEPSSPEASNVRPRSDMFVGRYEFFGDRYAWAS